MSTWGRCRWAVAVIPARGAAAAPPASPCPAAGSMPSVLRGCVRAPPRAPRATRGARHPGGDAGAVRDPRSASGLPGPARPRYRCDRSPNNPHLWSLKLLTSITERRSRMSTTTTISLERRMIGGAARRGPRAPGSPQPEAPAAPVEGPAGFQCCALLLGGVRFRDDSRYLTPVATHDSRRTVLHVVDVPVELRLEFLKAHLLFWHLCSPWSSRFYRLAGRWRLPGSGSSREPSSTTRARAPASASTAVAALVGPACRLPESEPGERTAGFLDGYRQGAARGISGPPPHPPAASHGTATAASSPRVCPRPAVRDAVIPPGLIFMAGDAARSR